jgi:D-alanyl-D-alanine carboxypeptidase
MIGVALSAVLAVAQGLPADSIGARLQALADSIAAAQSRIPGVLLFVESTRLDRRWTAAAGQSDTARDRPMRPDQPLRVASNTKTYTAAAILRLMERGVLALDDPVAQHLPDDLRRELERGGYRPDRITVVQLLANRAGLAEHPEVPSYVPMMLGNPTKRWTRLEQVRWMVDSLQPVGEPGERFKYSDTGYILLGAIVERYTGGNLGTGVRALLGFERLGLRHTWFETLEPEPAGAAERVHQYMNGLDTFGHHPSLDLYGGGGIAAPIGELGGFLTALFTGRVFERGATLDTMLAARSPEMGGYGLGIFRLDVAGRRGYGHSGFWGTLAAHFPADSVTLAVAVNEQSRGGAVFGALAAVLRSLFPLAALGPPSRP